jgi:RNA polymerase sigma-70 factor (ECF subfamily)
VARAGRAVASGGEADTAERGALEELCSAYWPALYAFIRRRDHDAAEAADLTQGFFAALLSAGPGNLLARADPSRGRFRALLLTAVRRYLADDHDRRAAAKRGGDVRVGPLDFDFAAAESRCGPAAVAAVGAAGSPADTITPERAFDRAWAMSLLSGALDRLAAECRAEGRAELFERLRPGLVGESDAPPQAETAAALGMTEGAVKAALHRLRRRYRDLLRAAVADTLEGPDPADVDAELRELLAALG